MAPPAATGIDLASNGHEKPIATTTKPVTEHQAHAGTMTFPKPQKFTDPYEEREYKKGRLALAFRIFAKLGFEEGVAGHITLRVRNPLLGILGIYTDSVPGSCRANILLGEPVRSTVEHTETERPHPGG